MKFGCLNSKNEYYYPFASHPRFKFFAYDRLRRHRTIDQCSVYMKLNPSDFKKTMQELMDIIDENDVTGVMKRLTAFSANIIGSASYWYKQKGNLEATFEQKECSTIFWTASYADNWWHCLQRLMPGNLLLIVICSFVSFLFRKIWWKSICKVQKYAWKSTSCRLVFLCQVKWIFESFFWWNTRLWVEMAPVWMARYFFIYNILSIITWVVY